MHLQQKTAREKDRPSPADVLRKTVLSAKEAACRRRRFFSFDLSHSRDRPCGLLKPRALLSVKKRRNLFADHRVILVESQKIRIRHIRRINRVKIDRDVGERLKLQELAESIRQLGVIQPITVKKVSVGRYQIISGERRFRACELAGLKAVPAYVTVVFVGLFSSQS